MTYEQTKLLKPGDRVYWTDPDGNLTSRDMVIATIDASREDCISITTPNGGEIQCLPSELKSLDLKPIYRDLVASLEVDSGAGINLDERSAMVLGNVSIETLEALNIVQTATCARCGRLEFADEMIFACKDKSVPAGEREHLAYCSRLCRDRVCEACGGKGWLLAENDDHGLRIERCDGCKAFDSDDEAVKHVANLAAGGTK
jgi:hypothetical protein